MSELAKLYDIADKFRQGTCPARLGERWCIHVEGHQSIYHVTDNGIAWITDEHGTIYDPHAIETTPSDPIR